MENIWLVGAGEMAKEYVKVFRALEKPFIVIGRGETSAEKFRESTKCDVEIGGLDKFLNKSPEICSAAVVSVGVEKLAPTTIELIKYGVRNILVEKPGGLNQKEITEVANIAKEKGAKVLVAYNRRFYSSVLKAQELLNEDGGVTSFNFEFTEWSHDIEKIQKAAGVKDHWFLANSSHVVDLAFHLGGKPKEICSFKTGGLSWHPTGSVFSGAGISENGAVFSYQANWEAPGRWAVEALSKNYRLIFRPMEKLHLMKKGSVAINLVEIDESLDTQFKPGLYRQVENFLANKISAFCSIEEQAALMDTYCQMANYKP